MSVTKKESIVPRGYTPEEVAACTKKRIEEEYSFIRQKEQEVRCKEDEVTKILAVIKRKKEEYRIESVQRVIEYIRSKKITDENRLDLLLCHCQNKLYGNIDGVELDLKEEVEQE